MQLLRRITPPLGATHQAHPEDVVTVLADVDLAALFAWEHTTAALRRYYGELHGMLPIPDSDPVLRSAERHALVDATLGVDRRAFLGSGTPEDPCSLVSLSLTRQGSGG